MLGMAGPHEHHHHHRQQQREVPLPAPWQHEDSAMRKDIKKSSYYVWFLGAQEAKGLRGPEYVLPVVRSLVEREREVEPFKVTLQVSHKGLKIVQNVPGTGTGAGPAVAKGAAKVLGAKPAKAETVKHLIPHHAVTCVLQQEDIVACILLLYNPVTKCPVHVHAYRCDSVETAQILCGQLQTLIERPENQKKLSEIEARLRTKGLLGGLPPGAGAGASRRAGQGHSPGSDGRSTRESESSGGSSSERLSAGLGLGLAVREERVGHLYDSLAAELREKLGADTDATHAPILLPPRDYDTVHRQKGNLASVDRRRCLNASIVGVNIKNVKNALEEEAAPGNAGSGRHKRGSGAGSGAGGGGAGHPAAQTSRGPAGALVGSSGGSSGIGSDHAPSPDNESDPRYLDNASSSGRRRVAREGAPARPILHERMLLRKIILRLPENNF
ncbi:2-oxoglutarate dehydrogenase, mitochondrial [Frankliniella fusca]|uniref:2-oxoglutarate dehydrogenase, mitochondrial n=1 Tax=Frankliniella fusca TaxID=407009 RepID=A0AAE1L7A6_9NEOP|nr:2-oxoglutarate dehydrogenase, mitochondrial [Frankliniella fusca]